MTAQELLDDLRSRFVERKGRNAVFDEKIKAVGIEDIENKLEKLSERYVEDHLLPPLLCVIGEDALCTERKVLTASIPMDSINAKATRVNQTEYLIVLNKRLLSLIYEYNELQFLFGKNADKIQSEDAVRHFAPIIDSYLTPNSGMALPVHGYDEISLEESMMITYKTVLQERFILAHELAHVVLEHIKPMEASNFNIDELLAEDYYQNERAKKEHEADALALRWMSALCKDPNERLMAAEVLVIFHLVECNLGFPCSDASHPSALNRIVYLRDKCGELFDGCGYSIDRLIENCKNTESFKIR